MSKPFVAYLSRSPSNKCSNNKHLHSVYWDLCANKNVFICAVFLRFYRAGHGRRRKSYGKLEHRAYYDRLHSKRSACKLRTPFSKAHTHFPNRFSHIFVWLLSQNPITCGLGKFELLLRTGDMGKMRGKLLELPWNADLSENASRICCRWENVNVAREKKICKKIVPFRLIANLAPLIIFGEFFVARKFRKSLSAK